MRRIGRMYKETKGKYEYGFGEGKKASQKVNKRCHVPWDFPGGPMVKTLCFP